MDGLEAVELKLSEVLVDNENRRFDSEYFKKDLMSFLNHLNNLQPLGTFVKNGYRVVYENTRVIDKEVGEKEKANTEVKNFKNSFLQCGRLDAEYYQPKYDELLTKVQQAEYYQLHELVLIKKSIEPGSSAYQEEGIPFIRVANLSKYGLTEPDIHLSINEVENIESLFPKKDTILLTKDGSVGIAYKVDRDLKVVTSGAILHLTVRNKKINPDYLTLVLNSILTQLQAERDAGGSIIQHWRMSEIEKVLIPIIDMEKQKKISQLIQTSFQLKKQSQQLLEAAKQAVEMAIEEGEEKAMEFIQASLV